MSTKHILYVVNAEGQCQSVQLSVALWERVEKQVKVTLRRMTEDVDPFAKPEPLAALAELKAYWDFTYPYEPSLHCEICKMQTDDWENDPQHPFHLVNANLGGLLVFRCKKCFATVRKKNFHRKSVIECTPYTPEA